MIMLGLPEECYSSKIGRPLVSWISLLLDFATYNLRVELNSEGRRKYFQQCLGYYKPDTVFSLHIV
jgi:hypothetical protein